MPLAKGLRPRRPSSSTGSYPRQRDSPAGPGSRPGAGGLICAPELAVLEFAGRRSGSGRAGAAACTRSLLPARGHLGLEERPPWVLDDAFALVLVGPAWRELRERLVSLLPGQVIREASAAVCTRSRYAEDRLASGAFAQYVILGAGLDSFTWRRPDLLRSLRVFEVDHPATQAWKLERARDLALPLSDSQVFVPADFEAEPVQDALRTAGFDWGRPALFSWTGVAPYLTAPAIESALRAIAGAAAGSELVV
jgi:methyltransferase (TIGR00027 family)